MTLPAWLTPWCITHLGAAPAESLPGPHTGNGLQTDGGGTFVNGLFGVRLDDGREVAVKARPDENGRVATCLQVQRTLAQQGFPCAAPLTGMTVRSGLAIHAEQWRPGGAMLRGDDPATAADFAVLLARLVELAADIEVGGTAPGAIPPPLPNPEWVRWDHPGPGHWPRNPTHDVREESHPLPAGLAGTALRVRARLARSRLPRVLGHADWETQNLRWQIPAAPASASAASRALPGGHPAGGGPPAADGSPPADGNPRAAPADGNPHAGGGPLADGNPLAGGAPLAGGPLAGGNPLAGGGPLADGNPLAGGGAVPWVVHDWDSMAWLPEAAIAGAAAGCFASAEIPTLAPVESSAAFLAAYQQAARPFSAEEIEVAWAASMWPALHNARAEVLWDQPRVALAALFAQADERLKLAGG